MRTLRSDEDTETLAAVIKYYLNYFYSQVVGKFINILKIVYKNIYDMNLGIKI